MLLTDNYFMALGDRLRTARKAAKMSQETLAKLVGVSQGLISDIENNVYPTSSYVPKMANILNIDALFLADGIQGNVKTHKFAQEPATYQNNGDEFSRQLLYFFNGMNSDHKDDLLKFANSLYSIDNPNDKLANPFKKKEKAK